MNRRTALGAIASVGLGSLAGCTSGSEFNDRTGSDAWTTLYHDTHNTNTVPTALPQERPTVAWRVEDAFRPDQLQGTRRLSEPFPVAADERIYLGGPRLTALDAATGRVVWETTTEFRSGLAVVGDRLFVTGWRNGDPRSGTLGAYDRTTGGRLWATDCGPVPSAPVPSGSGVIVPDERGHTAFGRNGGTLWRVATDGESVFPAAPPAVTDTTAYLPGWPTFGQYGLPTAQVSLGGPGREWTGSRRVSQNQRFYPPVLTDDRVLVPITNRFPPERRPDTMLPGLIAYDHTGTVRWRLPTATSVSTPAVSGDTGFVVRSQTEWSDGDPSRPVAGDATLARFDVTSGTESWSVTYNGFGFGAIAPIVANDTVCAIFRNEPQETGLLVAHTLDGERLWTVSLSERPHHLLAVCGRLYVTLFDGTLLALAGE